MCLSDIQFAKAAVKKIETFYSGVSRISED
jgi:hypothetical protein